MAEGQAPTSRAAAFLPVYGTVLFCTGTSAMRIANLRTFSARASLQAKSTGEKFLFSACLRVFSGTASCLCRVPNEALRRAARARRGMFTQSGQVSARMQWPEASMTREDFGLFNKGELLHRDFSVFPDVGYHRQLSRQDAPAGHGAVTLLSPQVLASQSSVPRLPQLATTQRWQPFRTMEREPTPVPLGSSWKGSGVAYPLLPLGASGGLPPPPPQKWNEEVRELFPRTTMTVKRDKAQLAAQRSNERWEKRLAQRQASQAWLSSPELA